MRTLRILQIYIIRTAISPEQSRTLYGIKNAFLGNLLGFSEEQELHPLLSD